MNPLSMAVVALVLAAVAGLFYWAFLRKGGRSPEEDPTYRNGRGEHLYYDRKSIRWREEHPGGPQP